jgi:hypothetical protein
MENEDVVIPQLISPVLDSISTSSVAIVAPTSSTSNSSSNIGDGSRYDIPQPLREDTVELRQPDLPSVQDGPIEDEPDYDAESTDDEEPLWHIEEKAMRK